MALLASLVLLINVGCERELSDDATISTFAPTGEIFTDNFVAMGEDFYLPFADSKLDAFSVDDREGFESNVSYRVDVPNVDDPTGNYAGAILRVDGAGRDLSGFTALTFYAKASRGVSIDQIGFGQDFLENKYQVTASNVSVGTNWQKYYIPIPDPSLLINERGVFWYAAGTQGTGGSGYVVWFDEIKFENLGTIAQPRPEIFNGNDISVETFNGVTIPVTGLTQTLNLPNGLNQTVAATPSYFQFTSSDPGVASVDSFGQISINSAGTAVITATIGGVQASGSITVNSSGGFVAAPIPTTDPANVISIFSDSYDSVADFNPGVFAGANTANIALQVIDNNQFLVYESIDFIGMGWNGTVNATGMDMIHLDVQLISGSGSNLVVELLDFGPDNTDNGFGDGSAGGNNISSQLIQGQWVSLDIPLNAFTLPTGGGGSGSPNLGNIGNIVLVSNNGASFFIDNIYFYSE